MWHYPPPPHAHTQTVPRNTITDTRVINVVAGHFRDRMGDIDVEKGLKGSTTWPRTTHATRKSFIPNTQDFGNVGVLKRSTRHAFASAMVTVKLEKEKTCATATTCSPPSSYGVSVGTRARCTSRPRVGGSPGSRNWVALWSDGRRSGPQTCLTSNVHHRSSRNPRLP